MEIIFQKGIIEKLRKKYDMLPKNSMEFGGVLCGNKNKNTVYVHHIIDIPSVLGSKNSYNFNRVVVRSSICSPYSVVGIWHTHPPYSPFPSDVDRKVSQRVRKIGCVLTSSLKCFQGERDINLREDV